MKYFIIGDSDVVLGARFAGIEGRAVKDAAEARQAFQDVLKDKSLGILILTDAIAESIRADVNRQRFEAARPLVVEIPGPEGPLGGPDRLVRLVREAVGIHI